jgi:ankyrin repeat protein
VLELLVAVGVDLDATNAYGRTPLHYAAMNGRTDEVEALLAAGAASAVPNAIGWTPLHDAAYNGQLTAARALLAAGAPLHVEAVAVRVGSDVALGSPAKPPGGRLRASGLSLRTRASDAGWRRHAAGAGAGERPAADGGTADGGGQSVVASHHPLACVV